MTMEGSLQDRVAIVTGSSRGIGRAIAIALAQAGATVVVNHSHSPAEAEETVAAVRQCGVPALVLQADVSARDEVGRMVDQTVKTFGCVDILVNNAARFLDDVPFWEVQEADWDRVLDTNLKGPFLCAQAVCRPMMERGRGAIVNISSLGSQVVMAGMAPYVTSKGGVESLTRAMALELAPYGIRANAIAPGHINTQENLEIVRASAPREQRFKQRIALGRLGRVEEIGAIAAFLASDAASYMTGQTLYADGGIMIWQGPLM